MSEVFVPLAPNWRTPVRETFSFLTEIFTSRSGREQRRSHMANPRVDVGFDFLATDTSIRALAASLNLRSDFQMEIPDPTASPMILAAPASAGDTEIQIISVQPWIFQDQDVGFVYGLDVGREFLIDNEESTDFNEDYNEDFGSGGVFPITVNPLTRNWPAGTGVYPLSLGRVNSELSIAYETGKTGRGSVLFRKTRAQEVVAQSVPVMFLDKELFTFNPNWSTRPSVGFISPEEEVDFGKGQTKFYKPINFNYRKTQFSYLGINKVQTLALRDFFLRHRGRFKEFWCPSFMQDLEVTIGVNAGDTGIRVFGTDVATIYSDSVHRAVCVNFSDGTSHYSEIVEMFVETTPTGSPVLGDFNLDFNEDFTNGFGLLGQQTYIRLAQPFPVAKRKSEISSVSWLFMSRFSTDEMTIEWVTSQVARIVVNVTALERE
jgi:hypothetical protein